MLRSFSPYLLYICSIYTLPSRAQKDNNEANCDCYLTNGSTPSYFQYHTFDDFRTIDTSLVVVPTVLQDVGNDQTSQVASDYFTNDWWTSRWEIQNWNNSDTLGTGVTDASVLMVNSANNVYAEYADIPTSSYQTHLTLRTNRQAGFQSVSEIDSVVQNYKYISARFYARVLGSEGACAGMFTYRAPTTSKRSMSANYAQRFSFREHSTLGNVQEADIEILTSGPRNMVQYTNQPSNLPNGNILAQATANETMPANVDWSVWNEYRLDWTKGKSEWYVNGVKQVQIKFQAPTDPAQLIINMWSDGGSWTGNMSTNDYAYLQIQYLQVVFNTSGPVAQANGKRSSDAQKVKDGDKRSRILNKKIEKRKRGGCKIVCSIDHSTSVGTPVLLVDNTGSAVRERGSWLLMSILVFVTVFAGIDIDIK